LALAGLIAVVTVAASLRVRHPRAKLSAEILRSAR
jgi:hypothetical protein